MLYPAGEGNTSLYFNGTLGGNSDGRTRKFSLSEYLSDIVFKAILCTVYMVGSQRRVGEHNMNIYI